MIQPEDVLLILAALDIFVTTAIIVGFWKGLLPI